MSKLKAYHRPDSPDQALQLLARSEVNTTVMGGGTYIAAHLPSIAEEIVDLQDADLANVTYTGQELILGAMVRLQTLVDDGRAPALLREAAQREGPNTLRAAATIGGTISCPSRESEFLAALLIYDTEVQIQSLSGSKNIPLTRFLQDVGAVLKSGNLVTAVTLSSLGKTASARVARTPADKPIVAVLGRRRDDGKIKLALCGADTVPVLVEPDNVKAAINPPNDFRGSREYRRQMAATLARRVLDELS